MNDKIANRNFGHYGNFRHLEPATIFGRGQPHERGNVRSLYPPAQTSFYTIENAGIDKRWRDKNNITPICGNESPLPEIDDLYPIYPLDKRVYYNKSKKSSYGGKRKSKKKQNQKSKKKAHIPKT